MKKILVVEDEPTLQNLYLKALVNAGFDTAVATTGMEGFTKAKNNKPDLILLDIMLPGGKNGFDILQMLKSDQELKTVPVICMTNLDSERETAISLGAIDYYVKSDMPILELVAKVTKITASV
jgi:DNA-binding response OmpR family regulator